MLVKNVTRPHYVLLEHAFIQWPISPISDRSWYSNNPNDKQQGTQHRAFEYSSKPSPSAADPGPSPDPWRRRFFPAFPDFHPGPSLSCHSSHPARILQSLSEPSRSSKFMLNSIPRAVRRRTWGARESKTSIGAQTRGDVDSPKLVL